LFEGGVNREASLQEVGMQMLAHAFAPAAGPLELLRPKIFELLPTETLTSKAIIAHIFSSGGKLVRPAMFFLSCKLTGYEGDHLLPIGAVCEYVHCASLLHDDVVDNSSVRRNKPTANSRWGDQAAVLVGDLIYSRASELMAATGKIELVSTFAGAIRKMSEGELLQLENIFNPNITEDEYLRLLKFKTGVLIGAACRAGGILADAAQEQRDALEEFGINIGIAFQLMDDALDYVGSREVFGKPTRSDLLAGKVTMPILLLRGLATSDELAWLEACVSSNEITPADVDHAASLVSKYKSDHLTVNRAAEFTEKAMWQLRNNFPGSPARTQLEDLAKSLLFRIS
jgi:octaprenyl-diphosphate synthase